MEQKKTFGQGFGRKVIQAVVRYESVEWPPHTPWGLYQPKRPKENLCENDKEKNSR